MWGVTAKFLVLQGRNEVKKPKPAGRFLFSEPLSFSFFLSVLLVTVVSIKTKKNNLFIFVEQVSSPRHRKK